MVGCDIWWDAELSMVGYDRWWDVKLHPSIVPKIRLCQLILFYSMKICQIPKKAPFDTRIESQVTFQVMINAIKRILYSWFSFYSDNVIHI